MTSVREAIDEARWAGQGHDGETSFDVAAFEAALEARGFAVVPLKATEQMLGALKMLRYERREVWEDGLWSAVLYYRPRVGKEG